MKRSLFAIAMLLMVCGQALAVPFSLVLQWDENRESDLATGIKARYKIYIRQGRSLDGLKANASRVPIPVTVADDENGTPELVQFTVKGLDSNISYFIAVTALDEAGNESYLSNEVQIWPTPSKPIIATIKENGKMFLISDPQKVESLDYYEVDIDGAVVRADVEVAGDAVRLHHDLVNISMGNHTVRVRATNSWGAGAWSDPLAFTAALPGKVSGVGLSAD
ncbi:MAG: hypothetical protein KKF30_10475 [Proteobacteria bacterium]|nr:hypothetical protein [Pseudomonadota bacterium]MBU4470318.1 hypothetical protein [Pseudomonadota bacterium]MCG2752730.1 hypothetical protein [Desulfobacteraceae bacterium]